MDELLKSKADKIIAIHDTIKHEFRWTSDELTCYFTSLIFALSDKELNVEQFSDIRKFIKDNTSLFSHYRSYELFTITALLITKFDNPRESFMKLLLCESKLSDTGFKKGHYLAISALAVMLTCKDNEIDEQILRAREIYKKIKEKHFWLTGQDDYPLSVLIAASKENEASIMTEIELCYDTLHEEGFSRSNGLQQLSHILSFGTGSAQNKARRCRVIIDYLKEHKIHVYSQHYGLLGVIALSGDSSTKLLDEIIEVVQYLREERSVRWLGRETVFLISSSLVCNKYIEDAKMDKRVLEASIGISLEALIAAQIAASVAVIAATSAAASASSSSS